jgi:cytochrome b561
MTAVAGGNSAGRQHLLLALLAGWLVVTSPWVSMLRKVPTEAGFWNYSHLVLGLVCLVVAVTYLATCTRGGGWRLYFPWLAGEWSAASRDVRELFSGRIPAAEGGGLFGVIEGFALLALLATALTGAAWFATQGSSAALDWREFHSVAARVMAGLVVAHVVSVSLHLVELVRS